MKPIGFASFLLAFATFLQFQHFLEIQRFPKNSHRNSHRNKKTHTKSTRQDTARYDKQSRETVVAQGLCANKIRQEKSRKNKRFIAGSQEVSGSIPLISTRKSSEIVRFQDFFFAFALFDQRYRLASPKASPHPTRMRVPLLRIRTHSDLTHQEGEKAAQRTRGRN